MSGIIRIAALAVAAALCGAVVRKQAPEIALVLALAAGTALLLSCIEGLSAVLGLIEELTDAAGLSAAAVKPVVKVAGIGIVTKIAADICRDAQQGGLASFVETSGTFIALFAVAPLLTWVLDAIVGLL